VGQLLVVAYGMGVDSTAMLIGLSVLEIRPDLILFADTGGEKDETYAYQPIIDQFLESAGFPPLTTVRYVPQDFKHWPPYHTLEENCLTNGTLPSLAFGFKSCSLKWKAAPQNRFCDFWEPAVAWWAQGGRVLKAIGFDAGAADQRRRNHAGSMDDPKYQYWYPLIEWDWNRERCADVIRKAGLPLPPKSSCWFCPAMKPYEVDELPRHLLRRIVVMEARAKPRLTDIDGLWRTGCKGTRGSVARPGSITEYIRERGLLPSEEIDRLVAQVPTEIVAYQEAFARGEEIPTWDQFFCSLDDGDEVESEHDRMSLPVLF
jgi:hypothetical protein